jgi:hypothetical protein
MEDHMTSLATAGSHVASAKPCVLAGPYTCCVALRAQVTRDRVGEDVEILADLPRVEFGEPNATLAKLISHRLEKPGRDTVLAELRGIGPLDPRRPLLLERLHEGDGGLCVHLEAKTLPATRAQRTELNELLSDLADPYAWHEDAWAWAELIEEQWRAAAPDGRLPVRYLEDAFAKRPPVLRDAVRPADPAPMLAAA